MTDELTIYGYKSNGSDKSEKHKPLVHLLAVEYGDVESISFHPDDAPMIADAILRAARAVKRNRDFTGLKIILKEQE